VLRIAGFPGGIRDLGQEAFENSLWEERTMDQAITIFTRPAAYAWVLAVVLVSVFPAHAGQADIADVRLDATVDACVQKAMADFDIPGLAVAVVVDGEIAFERGYGVKHRDQGGVVDEHTLFRYASVGKMFNAAAVLRLVDQGVVRLSDPVTEYVPELHFAPGRWHADQIKLRHLINNTAAIPSFRSSPNDSFEDWVATLADTPLLSRPGAFFNYSNSNFALAGFVVERASGMSINDFMAAEVYRPAGMNESTRYPAEAVASGNYSFGHADDGSIYAPDDYTWIDDGFTSAHDLARWAQIMMSGGGEVLSRSSATAAQSPQARLYHDPGRPTSIGGGDYGFGLFVNDYPDGRVVQHSGGIPGWVARVAWIPSRRFAVAIVANSWESAFHGIFDAKACIFERHIGFSMPDMSQPSDASTWRPYAGTYSAVYEDGFEFEVVVEFEDGELLMTAPDPNDSDQIITRVLENIHESTFRFRPNPQEWWDVTFIRGRGKMSPVRWLRNLRFVGVRQLELRRGGSRLSP
jgi:CubicO group peptidase (beta-lactamase class C family)